jgi:hypothetical protein
VFRVAYFVQMRTGFKLNSHRVLPARCTPVRTQPGLIPKLNNTVGQSGSASGPF